MRATWLCLWNIFCGFPSARTLVHTQTIFGTGRRRLTVRVAADPVPVTDAVGLTVVVSMGEGLRVGETDGLGEGRPVSEAVGLGDVVTVTDSVGEGETVTVTVVVSVGVAETVGEGVTDGVTDVTVTVGEGVMDGVVVTV